MVANAAQVTVKVLVNSTMLEEEQHRQEQLSNTFVSRSFDAHDDSTEPPVFPPDAWPHIDYYIHYWNLTPSQSNALLELRDCLVDVTDLGLNRPMNVVRYLRAQTYSPRNAEIMFRNMLEWRRVHRVDTLLMTKDYYSPPQELVDLYPGAILKGSDLRGDPIFLNRTGVTDIMGLLERYGHEAMIQYEIYRRESGMIGSWIPEWERQSGRPIKQVLVIEDLHSLSGRVLSSKVAAFYGQVMDLDQNNYPDAAKKIVVIRAPAIFCAAWAVAKRFFPPFLHEKMCFCGVNNYLQVLSEYVDVDVLPPCINPAGRGQVVDGMSSNLEGGLVSKARSTRH